jgi:hypothetical protein
MHQLWMKFFWAFWDEPKPFNLNQTKHWGGFFSYFSIICPSFRFQKFPPFFSGLHFHLLLLFCYFFILFLFHYRKPSFGFATKAKGLQGCRSRRSPRITSHTLGSVRKCEGVWGSEPSHSQATPTLGNGVPVDFQNFKERFQGSKLNGLWRYLYHWKTLGT